MRHSVCWGNLPGMCQKKCFFHAKEEWPLKRFFSSIKLTDRVPNLKTYTSIWHLSFLSDSHSCPPFLLHCLFWCFPVLKWGTSDLNLSLCLFVVLGCQTWAYVLHLLPGYCDYNTFICQQWLLYRGVGQFGSSFWVRYLPHNCSVWGFNQDICHITPCLSQPYI